MLNAVAAPVGRIIRAAVGDGENSAVDLREGIRFVAASDDGLRQEEAEELENVRANA